MSLQRRAHSSPQAKNARAAGKSSAEIEAELRVFVDTHDKPVKIDGHEFPPLARIAIAQLSPEQLQAHLVDNYSSNFATLSAVDKKLMGVDSDARMTAAWAEVQQGVDDYRKKYPGEPVTRGELIAGAAAYDKEKGYGGKFLAEVKFAYAPRWKHYQRERIYTQSKNKAAWRELLDAAKQETTYIAQGYSATEVRQQWADFVASGQIKEQQPALWRELQPYLHANPRFLEQLISTGHP